MLRGHWCDTGGCGLLSAVPGIVVLLHFHRNLAPGLHQGRERGDSFAIDRHGSQLALPDRLPILEHVVLHRLTLTCRSGTSNRTPLRH
jgi:hypothetical protein